MFRRVAEQVRATLGDELWSDFVAPHANVCFKDAFLSAFRKPILRCVSIPHGGACPRNFHVDLTSARGHATLGVPAPEPQAGLGRDVWQVVRCASGCDRHVGYSIDGRALVLPGLLGARQPGSGGGHAALLLQHPVHGLHGIRPQHFPSDCAA